MALRIVFSFIAGVLGVVVFFSAVWAILQSGLGLLPETVPAPWAYEPTVPPLNVPRFVNLPFWGGVWGIVLGFVLARARGAAYWIGWTLLGAIALPLVAIFVVPLVKGQSMSDIAATATPARFMLGAILNGAWGLGTAVFLKLFQRAR